jgi:hypothetical protein
MPIPFAPYRQRRLFAGRHGAATRIRRYPAQMTGLECDAQTENRADAAW